MAGDNTKVALLKIKTELKSLMPMAVITANTLKAQI